MEMSYWDYNGVGLSKFRVFGCEGLSLCFHTPKVMGLSWMHLRLKHFLRDLEKCYNLQLVSVPQSITQRWVVQILANLDFSCLIKMKPLQDWTFLRGSFVDVSFTSWWNFPSESSGKVQLYTDFLGSSLNFHVKCSCGLWPDKPQGPLQTLPKALERGWDLVKEWWYR